MEVNPDSPVGRLVAEHPELAEVLESFSIDYCCDGAKTLQEAAQDRVQEVVDSLRRACEEGQSAGSWVDRPLAELIDHIVDTHHGYLRRELPELSARMNRCVEVHGPDMPQLREIGAVLQELVDELVDHMLKEEHMVFPAVRTGHPGIQVAFSVLESEHDHANTCTRRMRALTNGYVAPPDSCGTLRALYTGLEQLEKDLRCHIHLENEILFPRALSMN